MRRRFGTAAFAPLRGLLATWVVVSVVLSAHTASPFVAVGSQRVAADSDSSRVHDLLRAAAAVSITARQVAPDYEPSNLVAALREPLTSRRTLLAAIGHEQVASGEFRDAEETATLLASAASAPGDAFVLSREIVCTLLEERSDDQIASVIDRIALRDNRNWTLAVWATYMASREAAGWRMFAGVHGQPMSRADSALVTEQSQDTLPDRLVVRMRAALEVVRSIGLSEARLDAALSLGFQSINRADTAAAREAFEVARWAWSAMSVESRDYRVGKLALLAVRLGEFDASQRYSVELTNLWDLASVVNELVRQVGGEERRPVLRVWLERTMNAARRVQDAAARANGLHTIRWLVENPRDRALIDSIVPADTVLTALARSTIREDSRALRAGQESAARPTFNPMQFDSTREADRRANAIIDTVNAALANHDTATARAKVREVLKEPAELEDFTVELAVHRLVQTEGAAQAIDWAYAAGAPLTRARRLLFVARSLNFRRIVANRSMNMALSNPVGSCRERY